VLFEEAKERKREIIQEGKRTEHLRNENARQLKEGGRERGRRTAFLGKKNAHLQLREGEEKSSPRACGRGKKKKKRTAAGVPGGTVRKGGEEKEERWCGERPLKQKKRRRGERKRTPGRWNTKYNLWGGKKGGGEKTPYERNPRIFRDRKTQPKKEPDEGKRLAQPTYWGGE